MTAVLGFRAPVAIDVAIALPVSWNPLVKSNASAVTINSTRMIMLCVHGAQIVGLLERRFDQPVMRQIARAPTWQLCRYRRAVHPLFTLRARHVRLPRPISDFTGAPTDAARVLGAPLPSMLSRAAEAAWPPIGEVDAVNGFLAKIVAWLNAGYPEGVPGPDRVPLHGAAERGA